MSQLKLSGDASGTGIVTVAAPNTNSTYTVTLPAAAGTIITTASSATPTTLGPVYGKSDNGSPYETALGYQALAVTSGGAANVAVGYRAGYAITSGQGNIAIGAESVYAVTTGSNNIGIGRNALQNNTASNNVGIGYNALIANTTGASNTAVGYLAGDSISSGNHNACIGAYAGQYITTGNHNIAIGYDAGLNHTTGTQNIFLGRETRGSAVTASQQFVIGYNVVGQADDTITIGDSGGKIYNSYKVNATWTQTSDGRLKKNVQNDALGLSFINRLRPVTYEWKASNELEQNNPYYAEVNNRTIGVTMHGFIAQEVKAALDAEGCNTFNGWDQGIDGVQNISREMFISPLVKAVQELSAQVQALQAEIATLKGA